MKSNFLIVCLRVLICVSYFGVMLDTFEWGYVGESGEEVIARNSHSLGIVSVGSNSYLALYGGASPEHGPLGDTMYALLPASEAIGMDTLPCAICLYCSFLYDNVQSNF